MDPKHEAGIRNAHTLHQTTTCLLGLGSITTTFCNGQQHHALAFWAGSHNPQPAWMQKVVLPSQERVFTRFLLFQTQPACTQGRAEGMHKCKLIYRWQNGKAAKNSWLHFRNLNSKSIRVKMRRFWKTAHLQDVSLQVFCLFKFL